MFVSSSLLCLHAVVVQSVHRQYSALSPVAVQFVHRQCSAVSPVAVQSVHRQYSAESAVAVLIMLLLLSQYVDNHIHSYHL